MSLKTTERTKHELTSPFIKLLSIVNQKGIIICQTEILAKTLSFFDIGEQFDKLLGNVGVASGHLFFSFCTIYNNVVNRLVNDDKLVDTICPPPCRVSRKLKHHPATMTAPSPFRTLLAVLLLTSLQLSSSFTTGSQRGTSTISCRSATSHGTRDVDFLMTASNYKQSDESTDATFQPYQKKMFISSILSILLFLSLGPNSITPPHANAIQEKNEALCNTGFFTNVGAWYCTDIGNIGDEGKSKELSPNEEASVDSLMSKFDLHIDDVVSRSGDGKSGGVSASDEGSTRGGVNEKQQN